MATQAELIIWRDGKVESRYALTPGALRIGRSKNNEVTLESGAVSRVHAIVQVSHRGIVIEDRSSGNGLYHRGGKIMRKTVRDGDLVFLDPFVLEFAVKHVSGNKRVGRTADVVMHRPRAQGRLTLMTAPNGPKQYTITSEITDIGRSERRTIAIDDPAASRKHAEVLMLDGTFVLRDLKSANGTFLNGRRVYEACIRAGDEIRIGAQVFQFETAGAARSATKAGAPKITVRQNNA